MMNRRMMLGLLAATPFLTRPAYAAAAEVFSDAGLAIRGTDPVAYFTKGMAVPGSDAHKLMWRGATWTFESAENLAAFEMNPDRYGPQYGGYCAYAMSKGALASTDPAAWTIVDDKLYLNYSINVRQIWSEDIPGNIALADANWPAVLG